MKHFILFITIIIFNLSCNTAEKPSTIKEEQTVSSTSFSVKEEQEQKTQVTKSIKKRDWQENFGLTHDINKDTIWFKPVRFYLENEDCNQAAKDFYYGKKKPTDDQQTADLLDLVITENDDLRPFYRWILNKTIIIQDGALWEYTGSPARKYAEKYPIEFFEYMDSNKSGKRYLSWYNSILYSGFYDYGSPLQARKKTREKMVSYCVNCEFETIERIQQFTLDCFPN